MYILDENITKDQKELLAAAGIQAHQIGYDFHPKGIDDNAIVKLLKIKKGATFITRDNDFYRKKFCHIKFCIVFTDVEKSEVSFYVRKFLKLPFFNTRQKRMGKVVKLNQRVISFWENKSHKEEKLRWIAY